MTGIADVVITGGMPQQLATVGGKAITPRRKGLKQGGAWFLLGVLIVPLLGVLSVLIHFPEEIIGLGAIIFFLGGIVRMLFALLFESGNPADKSLGENVMETVQKLLNKQPQSNALPPQQSIPVDNYAPPRQVDWRDTNDLAPHSVTDNTTKLLQKDE